MLQGGGAALAGLAVLRLAGPAPAAGAARQEAGTVIPWQDQPAPNPVPDEVGHPLVWEELDSRFTPVDEFFTVKHYQQPAIDPATWTLTIDGLVKSPTVLTLADLMAMPRHEVEFTLECSGNTGLPFFIGGVGNTRWRGTPLNRVLKRVGVLDEAVDLVFWGEDSGEVTVVGGWNVDPNDPTTGPGTPMTFIEQFARSMSVADAMAPENLLCWGMGEHEDDMLTPEHGAPVRLIAPGWYGVANVKWLTRIEAVDQRFAGRFMARDYVTIREEQVGGEDVFTFATVGHDRLKSAPAGVVRRGDRYTVEGVAWGAPIKRVDVSIDGGPWTDAPLASRASPEPGYAWRMWTYRGRRPRRASTPSRHAHGIATATSSPLPTTPSSPPSRPTGRATARSPGPSTSRDATARRSGRVHDADDGRPRREDPDMSPRRLVSMLSAVLATAALLTAGPAPVSAAGAPAGSGKVVSVTRAPTPYPTDAFLLQAPAGVDPCGFPVSLQVTEAKRSATTIMTADGTTTVHESGLLKVRLTRVGTEQSIDLDVSGPGTFVSTPTRASPRSDSASSCGPSSRTSRTACR